MNSGPRVLLSRSAQLPMGYSIAQVMHPRVRTHFQSGVFSFTYVTVLKIACVIRARSDCDRGRIPSTEFRQQEA